MFKQQPTQFINPETSTYVGLADFPNEAQQKSVKRDWSSHPMVLGELGLGKSALINSLFLTDLYSESYLEPQRKWKELAKPKLQLLRSRGLGCQADAYGVDTPGCGDAMHQEDRFNRYLLPC